MKKLLSFLILFLGVFFPYFSAFASDIQPTNNVVDGYYTILSLYTGSNDTYVRQRTNYDFNAGDFMSISLVMESNGTAEVQVYGTCQYEGTAQFMGSISVSTLAIYTINGRSQNSHCYNSYIQVQNHDNDGTLNSVKVYGSLSSTFSGYAETYFQSPNVAPNIQDLAFAVNNAGGMVLPTPPNQTTRIENLVPVNGTTTATTSVNLSFDYFLSSTSDLGDETGLKVYLSRVDNDAQGETEVYNWSGVVLDDLTSLSHTFTLPTNSIWEYSIYFTRPPEYLVNEYQPVPAPLARFAVETNPSTGTGGYTTCDISNIAGCFQNAIIYLFYPSQTSVNQFRNLIALYQNKPPIGYIVAIQDVIGSVNMTGSSVFVLQSMPILNTYVFDVFRIGITWLMWLAFAFILFHRVKDLQL